MSAVYNLEPNPTARVVIRTTAGEIELELFAKQTPKTSRNFLQLCLDGYYDDTIFHRLVKGFIIQGGDPTGTGHGGESSYDGEPFEDEFHSRLKYNRRGLLGMANTGKADDNGSQFFLTLGNTPELTGKNTMFGRVVGDTIYNLMKMAEAEIAEGSEERPMYPTKIIGTEIVINPFDDMVRRARVAERTAPEVRKVKKPKRKAGKAVLSFGDDLDEEVAAPVKKKPKYNAALVTTGEESAPTSKPPGQSESEMSIPIRKPAKRTTPPPPPPTRAPRSPPREKPRSPTPPPKDPSPELSKLDRVNAQIAAVKASLKRNPIAQASEPTKKKSLLDSMVPSNTDRGRKRGAQNAASEQASLDILAKFKSRLEAAAPVEAKTKSPTIAEKANGEEIDPDSEDKTIEAAGEAEEIPCDLHFIVGCQSCKTWDLQDKEESDDDTGWMSHSLTFAKDRLGKDLEWKRKNEEELVVIDPRERAQELKAQKTGKREWDGDKDKRGKKGVGLGTR